MGNQITKDTMLILRALGMYKLKKPHEEQNINKIMTDITNGNYGEQKKDQTEINLNAMNVEKREKKFYSYFNTMEEAEEFKNKLEKILIDAYPDGVTIPDILTFAPYPYMNKGKAKYKSHITFKGILIDKLYKALPDPKKEMNDNSK
jgi:hypothetical protein